MAGGTPRHNTVKENLVIELGTRFRGGRCRSYSSDQRVKVVATGLYTYPDIVIVCGPPQLDTVDPGPNARLSMPASEWAWKLAVIAVVYVILYFTFGYFIAWRHAGVAEYYGGVDPGSFLAQMRTVLRDTPWLVPFQIVRAICWVALALPIIRMLKGQWPETALSIGLLFSVETNAPLLLPNPYMPEPVRMAHLVETASSNFIFGVFVGWLLTRRDSAGARVAPAVS